MQTFGNRLYSLGSFPNLACTSACPYSILKVLGYFGHRFPLERASGGFDRSSKVVMLLAPCKIK